jgi:hypothetical protein
MEDLTFGDVLLCLAIVGGFASWQALRYEHEPSSGAQKLAWRREEINVTATVIGALLSLLRKVDWSGKPSRWRVL